MPKKSPPAKLNPIQIRFTAEERATIDRIAAAMKPHPSIEVTAAHVIRAALADLKEKILGKNSQ